METPEIATLSEYNSQCKKAIPGDSTALRLRRLRKRARDRRPCPRQPGILIPTRRSWAPQRYRPGRLPNGIECTGRKSVQAAPGSGETPAGEFRPRAGGPRNPTAYTELLIPPAEEPLDLVAADGVSLYPFAHSLRSRCAEIVSRIAAGRVARRPPHGGSLGLLHFAGAVCDSAPPGSGPHQ